MSLRWVTASSSTSFLVAVISLRHFRRACLAQPPSPPLLITLRSQNSQPDRQMHSESTARTGASLRLTDLSLVAAFKSAPPVVLVALCPSVVVASDPLRQSQTDASRECRRRRRRPRGERSLPLHAALVCAVVGTLILLLGVGRACSCLLASSFLVSRRVDAKCRAITFSPPASQYHPVVLFPALIFHSFYTSNLEMGVPAAGALRGWDAPLCGPSP